MKNLGAGKTHIKYTILTLLCLYFFFDNFNAVRDTALKIIMFSNLDSFYFFFYSDCCGQNFQNYVE